MELHLRPWTVRFIGAGVFLLVAAMGFVARAQHYGPGGMRVTERRWFLSREEMSRSELSGGVLFKGAPPAWPNISAIAAMPLVPTVTTTSTPPLLVPCEYGFAPEGESRCPQGSASLTKEECQQMPYRSGRVLHFPMVIESINDPWGCFLFKDEYYYNEGLWGSGRSGRVPVCKRCQAVPKVGFVGWSEWADGTYLIRKASSRFRVAETSTCSDIGMYPIMDQVICEQAAQELLLGVSHANPTCFEERPEGCYISQGMASHQTSLRLNVNPRSRGNGAETSAFASQLLRRPLCATDIPAELQSNNSALLSCQGILDGFLKVSNGTCEDVGRKPILDEANCRLAAQKLSLADTDVEVISNADRPQGCYYYKNSKDLTATLWLNTSPNSSQSNATSHRHLLCTPIQGATSNGKIRL